MTAVDMSQFIIAKSDQLNADDLIGGPQTITVTKVSASPDSAEQPVSVHYEGDKGKPFKPCKSMRRVLAHVWGREGSAYVGRSMTVYRDDKVLFGGIQVGGIRISHMSDIERDTTVALMVTRGKRAPYVVKPLRQERRLDDDGRTSARDDRRQDTGGGRQDAPQGDGGQTQGPTLSQRADTYEERLRAAPGTVKLTAYRAAAEKLRGELDASDPERLVELEALFNDLFGQAQARERDA